MIPVILSAVSQDLWLLYQKVTFDGENKLIIINEGVTEIDIETDVYSAWKLWTQERDHLKWISAMRSTGGDPLPGGSFLGATFFLVNGWKIYVKEGPANISVTGNIYSEDGTPAFTTESGVQLLTTTVSNLIDKPDLGVKNASIFV
jgi:hypothetical protein